VEVVFGHITVVAQDKSQDRGNPKKSMFSAFSPPTLIFGRGAHDQWGGHGDFCSRASYHGQLCSVAEE
jgi:hypothetical protein